MSAYNNYERELKTRIYFNGSSIPMIEDVISATVTEMSFSGDSITLGDMCSNKAEIGFCMPETQIPLKNGSFKIEQGIKVDDEYIYTPMGSFYIKNIEKTEGTPITKVTGYDGIVLIDGEYVPTIEFPALISDVVKDICSQSGVILAEYEFPNIIIDGYVENKREMLSYMAQLLGKNVRMNRNNELEFYWFKKSEEVISRDIQYMNGYKKNADEDITINSLTCGDFSSGSGKGITFENPYMTQEILDSILIEIQKLTYLPATVQYRGNPNLQVCDMPQAEDINGELHNLIISEHVLILTGMNGIITCKGEAEETVAMSQTPIEIKINKLYNTLINSFKNTTEKILGNQGGYYRVDLNEEGFPSGWSIMNTPELRDDTKMWKFTSGGLGYSTDGGKTFTKIAFDLEGNFNANTITTGSISGEMFELDLETGTIKIGIRDENGIISDPTFFLNEKGELTIKAVETIEKTINELEIGGRNLLRMSNVEANETTYVLEDYYFGNVPPNEGETYTLTLKGTLGSDRTGFGIYNSGEDVELGVLSSVGNGLFRSTFDWVMTDTAGVAASNTFLRICQLPSSGISASTIEWIKLEKGNVATDWSPAPEDIEDNFVSVNESLSSVVEQTSSAITSSVESITERIEVLEDASEEYVTTETFSTVVTQTKEDYEIAIESALSQYVTGDELTEFSELIAKYFTFTSDGLIISDGTDEGITLRLDNGMICFADANGNSVAYWDGGNSLLHTGDIKVEVNHKAQFGNFAFIPRSDGSLSFLKVSDD